MNNYGDLRKTFKIKHGGIDLTKIKDIVSVLGEMAKDAAEPKVSITESKGTTTVTFTIYPGSHANAIKRNISPEEAVAFIGQVTGNKKLIHQRAANLHRAFTEANVRECYEEVLKGVMMGTGLSYTDAHDEFVKYISLKMGETKIFDSDALNELLAEVKKTTKSAAAKDSVGRVGLLHTLQTSPVSATIRASIDKLGYDVNDFLEAAKNHHFVHYVNRGTNGTYQLRKDSASDAFKKLKNKKELKESIENGDIAYDPRTPHIITNKTRAVPAGRTSDYVIASHAGGTRGEDMELVAAKEHLRSKNIAEDVINGLSGSRIKLLAESLGWIRGAQAA